MFFFQDAVSGTGNQPTGIAGSSCDLSSLDDPLCNDSDEILRQLADNSFELDSFFTEFNGVDVKVRLMRHVSNQHWLAKMLRISQKNIDCLLLHLQSVHIQDYSRVLAAQSTT